MVPEHYYYHRVVRCSCSCLLYLSSSVSLRVHLSLSVYTSLSPYRTSSPTSSSHPYRRLLIINMSKKKPTKDAVVDEKEALKSS